MKFGSLMKLAQERGLSGLEDVEAKAELIQKLEAADHAQEAVEIAGAAATTVDVDVAASTTTENMRTADEQDAKPAEPKPKKKSKSRGDESHYASLDMATIMKFEKQPGATPPLEQINRKNLLDRVHPSARGSPGAFSPAAGNLKAPVEVVLYSDFRCPNCKRVVEPLKLLARKFPKDVVIVFKQMPLESHGDSAMNAALASCAAGRQGLFWDYQDKLFANMNQMSREDLRSYALQVGVDTQEWQKELNNREKGSCWDQIQYERSLGEKLGVTGTPGFVINGQLQVGWASYQGLESMVTRAKGNKKAVCQVDGYLC